IVGGYVLFLAASGWCLVIGSDFVDMVFYSSVPSNNELIQQAKSQFSNGIVVRREDVADYIKEADCILIGPGMERAQPKLLEKSSEELTKLFAEPPSSEQWNADTELIVNYVLHTFPDKKWVIDAGALQMVVPSLLPKGAILTPHRNELDRLLAAMAHQEQLENESAYISKLLEREITLLLKGSVDFVYSGSEVIEIKGGNAGMTKGGTGDVLAGLVAALYCTQSADVATVVASYINKRAGEVLHEQQGPFFNASELVGVIPEVLWGEIQNSAENNHE
ncbi:MAG: ADP/ATP-dependent (S)-NAD(P)H-hydrate dehydratase, partial [Patescibacteria group bacterium]